MGLTLRKIHIIVVCSIFILTACHVRKGYEALEIYNYFEAKKQFEKGIDKNTSPSAFGLSEIYFRRDNPFHNIDSAYHYGLLAVESYDEVDEKKQLKWLKEVDYTVDDALKHRAQMSDFFFEAAKDSSSVIAMKHFIAKHPWSNKLDSAIYFRDELAYENVREFDKSSSYAGYIKHYPESHRRDDAREEMYKAQYNETITPGSVTSFELFISKYPNNPFVTEAQEKLYKLSVQENTIDDYEQFIKDFPKSPYFGEAWKNLYRLSIADYSKETISTFFEEYPEFPFPEMIESDLDLVGKELYLYKKEGLYGFMNREGEAMIQADYSYASNFSNGLAVVVCNDLFGFIDKSGELVIDCLFDEAQDFNQGKAIVEKDGFFGLINTTGEFVLKPEFYDIGSISEGLFYAENDKGFKYYSADGTVALETAFEEAFAFEGGLAKVKRDGVVGFIKKDGSYIVQSSQGDLKRFSDTIFVLKLRDSSTFIGPSGVLKNQYFDRIGVLKENRAIVSKEGKYGYVDRNANTVIELERKEFSNYFQFAQFENGHAKVFRQDRYALMDSLGKNILPAIFTGIGSYGKLIPVSKGNGWGYADRKVRLKIDYQFDYAYPFVDDMAIVELDGFVGLIGSDGGNITPIEFEELNRLDHGYFIFTAQGRQGLINALGDLVFEETYQRVTEVKPGLLRLEHKEGIAYFDITKNDLITLKK